MSWYEARGSNSARRCVGPEPSPDGEPRRWIRGRDSNAGLTASKAGILSTRRTRSSRHAASRTLAVTSYENVVVSERRGAERSRAESSRSSNASDASCRNPSARAVGTPGTNRTIFPGFVNLVPDPPAGACVWYRVGVTIPSGEVESLATSPEVERGMGESALARYCPWPLRLRRLRAVYSESFAETRVGDDPTHRSFAASVAPGAARHFGVVGGSRTRAPTLARSFATVTTRLRMVRVEGVEPSLPVWKTVMLAVEHQTRVEPAAGYAPAPSDLPSRAGSKPNRHWWRCRELNPRSWFAGPARRPATHPRNFSLARRQRIERCPSVLEADRSP
jgi:hypothetical protein